MQRLDMDLVCAMFGVGHRYPPLSSRRLIAYAFGTGTSRSDPGPVMQAVRSASNPIIRPGMDERMGDNVNGPSLVRVPDWIESPLGRYYLYFAHHDGQYIRLAVSDAIEGPWRIHGPGVLTMAQAGFEGHVASPDVHVDHGKRRIRMYFHGSDRPSAPGAGPQYTRLALSTDGLDFRAEPENLGAPYFRAFEWQGMHYAIGMPGIVYRSRDGVTGFERGADFGMPNLRHVAVVRDDAVLTMYFTAVGGCPETIQRGRIRLDRDWREWRLEDVEDVLAPELDYEGAFAPRIPSSRGLVEAPAYQLRDPAIFREAGRTWLLYSVSGEAGIALAEILE